MSDRRDQTGEALGDLKTLLLDPDAFGDTCVADAAVSLESEFVGEWRDDEISRRLDALAAAEADENLRVAARHARAVERKLRERWEIVALDSVPVIPDAEAKRPARAGRSGGAKPLVVEGHGRSRSPQTPDGGDSAKSARSGVLFTAEAAS